MTGQVAAYIRQHSLFTKEDTLLVALSGGADSVALLRVLLALGYTCRAAHCNFHLRGEESDRDEAFVRRLCEEQDVPLCITHFDTAGEAARRGISIEMAARELRYAWFEEVRQACGAARICVAHHRDDSAETFLLNLLRGTGIDGLCGIRPLNGYIARPLLGVGRADILNYLENLGQSYVTDSTNLNDEYLRNKIRLNVLPLLEEINPAARENLLRTAAHLSQAATLYHTAVDEALGRVLEGEDMRIDRLLAEPEPRALLHEWLAPRGFNASQEEDIFRGLAGQSGRRYLSATHVVVRDRDKLLLRPLNEEVCPPRLHFEEHLYTSTFEIPRTPDVACFDADKLKEPLALRLVRPGDTFVPFGMRGKKRVSDYLTDRKRSLLDKERQWVLLSGDEICWLVGERSDNRFRVTDDTRRVLLVSLKPIS